LRASDEVELKMLYYMKLARELETRIERKLYRQGKIVGGVYVGRGQEAISVGSVIHSRSGDVISPCHRDMGAFLIRGVSPGRILAQYMGRKSGLTRGRDGNMHMGDLKHGLIAFVSHLGDSVPVAVGIALSFKLRRQPNVEFCIFGDGATSTGAFHEGINFASVQQLPIVFICNNNQYAYSTPLRLQMNIKRVAERAAAYGIPAETIDGNDVLAVYETVGRAVERARSGGGPMFIECVTFRMTGHSAHDDARYVPQEAFQEWAKKDPILRLEKALKKKRLINGQGLKELDERIAREVDEAVEWAEAQPYPEPQECLENVYYAPELEGAKTNA